METRVRTESRETGEVKVFRDSMQLHRGDYYVEYHPAQPPYCATLNLIFPKRAGDLAFVRETMEREMEIWLGRYAVPVMVHGIDEKEDGIRFSFNFGESTLMGYVDPVSRRIVRRWGLFRDSELPRVQLEPKYLEAAYADVPFRLASEVRAKANRDTRRKVRGAKAIVFFIVAVPLLLEIVAEGVDWLGHMLAAISIAVGIRKAAKTFGWIKRSAQDDKKDAEELEMRHHHYHCQKNPEAFARLRAENFAREAAKRVRKEDEALRENTGA